MAEPCMGIDPPLRGFDGLAQFDYVWPLLQCNPLDPKMKFSRLPTSQVCACMSVLGTLFVSPCVLAGGVPATQLPAVQVHGETDPENLGEADSASAGVVTQEQIENRPISRPAEILEVVPGLVATQHSGDGKANQYFLRGFNLDHGTDLSVKIDDIPNNLRTHGHGQGYNDLNGLIPELLETIEYRKGPYYAQDGDFSSAGAVRMHYQDRLAEDFLQVTGGEDGYARGLLAASGAMGEGSWLTAIDAGVYDGPWENPEDMRKVSLLGKIGGGDVQNGYGMTFMLYDNSWDSSDQIPLRAVESGEIDRLGQIDPDLGGETTRYSVSGEAHWALGPGSLIVNAYAAHYDFTLYSNFTYFLEDPDLGDQFEQRDERNYYGGTAQYVQAWDAGGIQQELSVGLDTRYDNIDPVGLYHTQYRIRTSTVREDAVKEGSIAAFVSYSARWNEWLRTVIGGRQDYYRADVDSNIPENSGKSSDTQFSPKLSIILGPWSNTEVFLNAGRGFHSNDARGSTLTVDPNDPDMLADSQSLLVPTEGAEIGLRVRPTDTLTLSAALWQLDIGSELVFAGDGGTTEPSYPSERHGIELSAYYQPLPWLLIDIDYAHSYARFKGDIPEGNHIPNAVETVASIGAEFNGPGPWYGGVRYRYLGPAPLIEDNSVRSSSTSIVNAQMGYRFNEHVGVSLEVLNLFDSDQNDITYFYESQLANEPEAVEDIHFHPVEPRQFRLTFKWMF